MIESYNLCTVENEATQDYMEGNARWVVKLNDGVTVYSFDRQNEEADWLKLKRYCEAENKYIKEMYIHFRSNYVSMEGGKDGYFFRRGALGGITMDYTENYMYIGYLQNNKIHVSKYRVPEMILQTSEVREVEGNQDSLIRR